jgi:isovaleryl-CoA dehydrogenase
MATFADVGPDFGLGEDYDELRQAVRRLAEERIAPRAADIDRRNEFPRDLWPLLGSQGLLGVTVEPRWGGVGLGYLAHAIVMEELSRASGALALSYAAHSNLCMNQIRLHGSDAQRARWLPRLCSGEHVGALAISEPGAGSDVAGLQLRATIDAAGFVLDGHKMWITNGPEADVLVVYARTDPDAGGRGISAFIVPGDSPGLIRCPKLDKLGMRGSPTCELIFERCRIPADSLLGTLNDGMHLLMQGLDYERVILAAGPLGLMAAALDLTLPYVHARRQFGAPIGTFELMQAKMADMYTDFSACRAYVYGVARACDRGVVRREDAAGCVLYAAERATQVALQCVQALGGNGYMNEYPAGRLLRDAKLYEIGGGTQEIRRMLIGRQLYERAA